MPVVLADRTNKFWAAEDPTSQRLMVGRTGKGGYTLEDVLDFIERNEKRFASFISKKREVVVLKP